MKEIWISLPWAGPYEVSNKGRVKSFALKSSGHIMAPCDNGKGYLSVMLAGKRYYIHRLVMNAFVAESTMEINHKDLNKSNNHINNLEFVTRRQNQLHMIKNHKHNRAKLSVADRVKIKSLRLNGLKIKEIATQFKVSKSTVSAVINSVTWSWDK